MAPENLTQHTSVGPAAGGHGQAASLVSYRRQPHLYCSVSLLFFLSFPSPVSVLFPPLSLPFPVL